MGNDWPSELQELAAAHPTWTLEGGVYHDLDGCVYCQIRDSESGGRAVLRVGPAIVRLFWEGGLAERIDMPLAAELASIHERMAGVTEEEALAVIDGVNQENADSVGNWQPRDPRWDNANHRG